MLRRTLAVLMLLSACSPATPGGDGNPVPVAQACNTYSGGAPGARYGLLAYYRPGGYPMLFSQGGDAPSTVTPFATWTWKCGWTQVAGPDPNVWAYAMAYDPHLHETVLVGAKTMGWNGTLWQDLQVTPPLNLGVTSMVFDEAHHVLVLIDSYPSGVNTWTFAGGSWKKASASGPQNEAGAAVAYDPRSRSVILAGGFASGTGGGQQATWSWDGSAWRLLTPAAAPPGGSGVMAYDEAARQMILVGSDQSTWQWTGSTWLRLEIASPDYNGTAAMVYDSAHERLFYWVSGQVWTYTGTWAQLPAARS